MPFLCVLSHASSWRRVPPEEADVYLRACRWRPLMGGTGAVLGYDRRAAAVDARRGRSLKRGMGDQRQHPRPVVRDETTCVTSCVTYLSSPRGSIQGPSR